MPGTTDMFVQDPAGTTRVVRLGIVTDETGTRERRLMLIEFRLSRSMSVGLDIAPRSQGQEDRISSWPGGDTELKAFLLAAKQLRLVKGLAVENNKLVFLLFDKRLEDTYLSIGREFGIWFRQQTGLRVSIPKSAQARYTLKRLAGSEDTRDYADLALDLLDFVPGGFVLRMIRDLFD